MLSIDPAAVVFVSVARSLWELADALDGTTDR